MARIKTEDHYIELTRDILNSNKDLRKKYDWKAAKVFKAGTRFHLRFREMEPELLENTDVKAYVVHVDAPGKPGSEGAYGLRIRTDGYELVFGDSPLGKLLQTIVENSKIVEKGAHEIVTEHFKGHLSKYGCKLLERLIETGKLKEEDIEEAKENLP